MNRLLRVASATVLLVGALSASNLSLPGLTVACSCVAAEAAAPGVPPDLAPADAPPDLGLVAIALVTFVVGLTAVAAGLAFARRREPPPPGRP